MKMPHSNNKKEKEFVWRKTRERALGPGIPALRLELRARKERRCSVVGIQGTCVAAFCGGREWDLGASGGRTAEKKRGRQEMPLSPSCEEKNR